MILSRLVKILDQTLAIRDFEDLSWNGLQVGNLDSVVDKLAFSVDSGMEVFRKAVDCGAHFLFVHHGLFWGKTLPVVSEHYDRIKYLIDNDLSLYAVHLPLDAHHQLGNNAGIVKALGLENCVRFGLYRGKKIGQKGVFPSKKTIKEILLDLKLTPSDCVFWNFGSSQISSVAVISGDAPNEVRQAMNEDVDLYITGESSHALYHECQEAKINVLFAGHYNTECYGPRLVCDWIKKNYQMDSVFIDCPTLL